MNFDFEILVARLVGPVEQAEPVWLMVLTIALVVPVEQAEPVWLMALTIALMVPVEQAFVLAGPTEVGLGQRTLHWPHNPSCED